MAECYEFGRGTLKNPEKTFVLCLGVLRINDRPIDLNNLIYKKFGKFYHYGIGVPKDLKVAAIYYRKFQALEPNDSSVLAALGSVYYDKGQRFTKNGNTVKALKYYQLAAAHGHAEVWEMVEQLTMGVISPAVTNAP